MKSLLHRWEKRFTTELQQILIGLRQRAGTLLSVIPNRKEWREFLKDVQNEWTTWENDLPRFPSCLLVLYGGLAFYKYEEGRFWPHLAKIVETPAWKRFYSRDSTNY